MIEGASYGDRSAMLSHDPIGDCEADSGSAKLAASRLVSAIETFEDSAPILIGDSNPRVEHDNNGLSFSTFELHLDDSRWRSVFDGVVEQDGQQSLHGSVIGEDRHFAIRDRQSEL